MTEKAAMERYPKRQRKDAPAKAPAFGGKTWSRQPRSSGQATPDRRKSILPAQKTVRKTPLQHGWAKGSAQSLIFNINEYMKKQKKTFGETYRGDAIQYTADCARLSLRHTKRLLSAANKPMPGRGTTTGVDTPSQRHKGFFFRRNKARHRRKGDKVALKFPEIFDKARSIVTEINSHLIPEPCYYHDVLRRLKENDLKLAEPCGYKVTT